MKGIVTVTTADLRGDHKPIRTTYNLDTGHAYRDFHGTRKLSQAPKLTRWEAVAFWMVGILLLLVGIAVI